MLFDFFQDIGNFEQRKVNRIEPEENGGIGVSTAYTSDEGYETALLDTNGTHPVERNETREQAEKGHKKWVKFAKLGKGKVITKLGCALNPINIEITLVPYNK